MPNCLSCGSEVGEYDSGYYSRSMLCIPCYTAKASEIQMVTCGKCGMRIRKEEARQRGGGSYCGYCYSELDRIERIQKCEECGRTIESWQKSIKSSEGKVYHAECSQEMKDKRIAAVCSYCGKTTDRFKLSREGMVICSRCSAKGAGSNAGSAGDSMSASGSNHPILASFVDRIGQMIG